MAGPKNQVWKDISRALNSKISADGLYTFVKCNRHNIQHIINTEDDDAIMPMHTSEVCGLGESIVQSLICRFSSILYNAAINRVRVGVKKYFAFNLNIFLNI